MTADTSGSYIFDERDRALLVAARTLLTKVAAAKLSSPAELVSIAKVQHVFARLPRETDGVEVTIRVQGPRRRFGENETWHGWQVEVEDRRLSISSDGYFSQPIGGDSFTSMDWSAVPGRPASFNDYRERIWIVPDVWSFPDAVEKVEFDSGRFTIDVTDSDNPLLDDADYAGDRLAGDTRMGVRIWGRKLVIKGRKDGL